eukprot:gene26327-32893_t
MRPSAVRPMSRPTHKLPGSTCCRLYFAAQYRMAIGATGGEGGDSVIDAGKGGLIVTNLVVTPGQVFYAYIGGVGTAATGSGSGSGGSNGGGDGIHGAGGGGATDLRTIKATTTAALNSRVVVAGGGGGSNSGCNSFGGNGGGFAGAAGENGCLGGNGASGGGPSGSGQYGIQGTLGNGGDGQSSLTGGSGGGGGGSGSTNGGGGGGGSSFSTGTVITNTQCYNAGGSGSILIEYTVVTPVPTRLPTTQPTAMPSVLPTTSVPSLSPSQIPTALPVTTSAVPTTATPSAAPSTSPSQTPTVSPTVKPSASPSTKPTKLPTSAPTVFTLKATAWKSASSVPNAADFPETALLSSRPKTAIAFTGGGSRAYAAAFGVLSALTQLDLIKKTRYIAGISGGTWATIMYTYAQGVNDATYLPPIVNPEDITYSNLNDMTSDCALGYASADVAGDAALALLQPDISTASDAFAYALSKDFLENVGIQKGVRFSWNQATVNSIKTRNPALSAAPFILPTNTNRPFPVIGTTLVGPTIASPFSDNNHNLTMIEITPLYVGQMKTQDVRYNYGTNSHTVIRVGGVIEPFAFGRSGDAPTVGLASSQSSATLNVPPPDVVFDLNYACAASAWAPGLFLDSFDFTNGLGDLPLAYWSPADPTPTSRATDFVDGGVYENIPLISFLQRRVGKIALFINSAVPLDPDYDAIRDTYDGSQIDKTVAAFFGKTIPDPGFFSGVGTSLEKDQVFDSSDFIDVVQALQHAQSVTGNGIVSIHNLTTVENLWWGIPAGINVEISFNYLGRVKNWEAALSNTMQNYVQPLINPNDLGKVRTATPFNQFPNYPTKGGTLSAREANLLSDLIGWTVMQNAALYEHLLS